MLTKSEFVKYFKFGQAVGQNLSKLRLPKMYLYEGVWLPRLPVAIGQYPYAEILTWGGVYYLLLSSTAIIGDLGDGCMIAITESESMVCYYERNNRWVLSDTFVLDGAHVWTNHDIYKSSGSVLTSKASITYIYDEPELLAYNNIPLHCLPDYDASKTPYVTIVTKPGWANYVVCTSSKLTFNPDTGAYHTVSSGLWSYYRSFRDIQAEDFEWSELTYNESLGAGGPGNVKYWDHVSWTNYDMVNSLDGTVWMAASEAQQIWE